jgi:hypothetical protein
MSPLILLLGIFAQGWGAPLPGVSVSWLGNSFPGAQAWVQQDIRAMLVTPDGTVWTNVEWDEAGREVGVYKDGKVVGKAGHTHGWGYGGGLAIAVNSEHVFIAQTVGNEGGGLKDADTWPPEGSSWIGISRRLRSDLARPAPFAGGKGGEGDTLKGAFAVVAEVPDRDGSRIVGLAADDRHVYVADTTAGGTFRVLDAGTMREVSRRPHPRLGPLAPAPSGGDLWAIERAESAGRTPARLLRLDRTGAITAALDLPPDVTPAALGIRPDGAEVAVADAGRDQDIKRFSPSDGTIRPAGAWGQEGGILAGPRPGAFGDFRFNHPTGVGLDAEGNLYVASDGQTGGGGTVLESYDPRGHLRWRLLGLEFVDMADADPATGVSDVFTKEEHFRLDPNAGGPGREWGYAGYTVDRFRFPDDPRLHIWSAGAWVRRLDGERFLFVNDMNAEHLQVYRFEPDGEIAVPCALFAKRHIRQEKSPNWPPHQPDRGAWAWIDADGDGRFDAGEYAPLAAAGADLPAAQGWWVDATGDVWLATERDGIHLFTRENGLNPKGVPTWDTRPEVFPHPRAFDRVKRLRYDPATDAMFLGGTTAEHANQHWKPMGPAIARYDAWRAGPRGPSPRWRVVAPYAKGSSGHESCEPMGFDLAGDYLFVPYTGASRAHGVATGHVEVLRAADGSGVGSMEPSPEVGEIGLQDVRECLRAVVQPDGAIAVFLEEDWKSKILVYRWRP